VHKDGLEMGFTDRISKVAVEKYRLARAFVFDRHFRQIG
jgi:predicted nucleic acid-binding protein